MELKGCSYLTRRTLLDVNIPRSRYPTKNGLSGLIPVKLNDKNGLSGRNSVK